MNAVTIAAVCNNTTFDSAIKIHAAALLPFLDWRQVKAQFWEESRLDPYAVSPVGAKGIAQMMDDTFIEVSKQRGWPDNASPFFSEVSIDCGCAYMLSLWNQWTSKRPIRDRWYLTLASYNAGLGSILTAQQYANGANDYQTIIEQLPFVTGKKNAAETSSYVTLIQGYYDQLRAGTPA